MSIELLLASTTAGLPEALAGYGGITPFSTSNIGRVKQLLASEQPPGALYIDDTRGTLPELWAIVHLAQRHGVRVFIGLQSVGVVHAGDFTDAGLAVSTEREPARLAAWLAQQLGAAKKAAGRQVTIAVGGAKGGIGKSLVVAMLAEGMVRRGLRVLVIDGDLSNSGLVPTFRIPAGFGSFLTLRQEGTSHAHFTPANIARLIYHHQATGIDFLLGADEAALAADFTLYDWRAMMQAVSGLGEVLSTPYDVVLVDTGPDMKKRPYAIDAVRNGGWVILPAPPGRKERAGVGVALEQFASHHPDLTDRCLLLLMAPEKGVIVTLAQVAPLFTQRWPQAHVVGALPRDPMLVSMADETADRYASPLLVGPHSAFSRAVHDIVDRVCATVSLTPPLPKPQSTLLQRLFPGRFPSAWATPDASVNAAGSESAVLGVSAAGARLDG
jgi:MinD-like ATPase involved in chromosome partitioning or flagellar assembly